MKQDYSYIHLWPTKAGPSEFSPEEELRIIAGWRDGLVNVLSWLDDYIEHRVNGADSAKRFKAIQQQAAMAKPWLDSLIRCVPPSADGVEVQKIPAVERPAPATNLMPTRDDLLFLRDIK